VEYRTIGVGVSAMACFNGRMPRPAKLGMFDKMLRIIARIPKGKVATYGDIAYAAGFPGAARQVAWALHGSHGLPWQRVIGSGGKILLGGHHGMEQRIRLEQEGIRFIGLKVDLKQHRCPFPLLRPPKKKAAKPRARR
jgi:methylated-DNA-protein-cysteine methyltransferase related protein